MTFIYVTYSAVESSDIPSVQNNPKPFQIKKFGISKEFKTIFF